MVVHDLKLFAGAHIDARAFKGEQTFQVAIPQMYYVALDLSCEFTSTTRVVIS